MSHQIISDLEKRYTAKQYDATKRISPADLEVIYESLRLSPSSINSQPWKFIVIESDEAKQRMYETFANKHQFNQHHIKEASHTILLAHKTHYNRDDFAKVVDKGIIDGRTQAENRDRAFGSFAFAAANTDENGNTSAWTKSQVYIALGNVMHTLARLGIDSTPMEGVDPELIGDTFKDELEGYQCDVALVMGYHHKDEDYNAALPKSRLAMEDVVTIL